MARPGPQGFVERNARIVQLYMAGKSYTAIGNELGLNRNIVAGVLRRKKAPKRGWRVIPDEERQEVILLREKFKWTYDSIAQALDISNAAAWRIYREHCEQQALEDA